MRWDALGVILGVVGITFGVGAWYQGDKQKTIDLQDEIDTIKETYLLKDELPSTPDLSAYALKNELPKILDLSAYALKNELPNIQDLSGIPSGAVVAVQSSSTLPCPGDDWEIFTDGIGRFVVGAGIDGGSGLTPKGLNEKGGAETVVLKIEEIPSHTHEVPTAGTVNSASRGSDRKNLFQDRARTESSKEGGGMAHENMPPYIALYLCQKK
jgi:hypothetical protein